MIYEVSYVTIKNLSDNEIRIAFNKWFRKHQIVRITHAPLVNFQSSIINSLMRKVLCAPDIQLTEINSALQYFDLSKKKRKDEPVIPTVINPQLESTPQGRLPKVQRPYPSSYGKSTTYGEYTVIEWDKQIAISKDTDAADIKLIEEAEAFLQQFPHHTSQGFPDIVKMHNAKFSALGCFIASYLTACDYQITEEDKMQEIIASLIHDGKLDNQNRISLDAVNYLHKNRALVHNAKDAYVLDHYIITKLGSTTLLNRVAEVSHITNIDLLHQICAMIETILLVCAPSIYDVNGNKKNTLISFHKVMLNNSPAGYNLGIENTIKDVLNLIVLGMNSIDIAPIMSTMLDEYLTSTDEAFKITLDQVQAIYNIILSFRRSIVTSLVEYHTAGNKQHLTVLYPKTVDSHCVTFDPRWSGCNTGVKYFPADKMWAIVYDLLYDTEEYAKYLKKLQVVVNDERFVIDVPTSKTFYKWIKKIENEIHKSTNTKDESKYGNALKVIHETITEPIMSNNHYISSRGSAASNVLVSKLLKGVDNKLDTSIPSEA